jgi:sugar phosphate isomerase/epimerase
MLSIKKILLVATLCASIYGCATRKVYQEEKLGWKLGAQTYTFNRFSFLEALKKVDSCGLRFIEAYPTQKLGGNLEGTMDYHMSLAKQQQVKDTLSKAGIKLVAYGVVSPKTPEDWRTLFTFSKQMGIETIVSEPAKADMALISALCDEYQINVAIHNHPKPSIYWHPDTVLKAISGKSQRLGACADVGHWVRSGLDPVSSLRKLEGRVLHSHMKDLNETGVRNAHDVPWGTGVTGIAGVVDELKRQRFKGMLSVEYEYHWLNNVPEIKESVQYFRGLLAKD